MFDLITFIRISVFKHIYIIYFFKYDCLKFISMSGLSEQVCNRHFDENSQIPLQLLIVADNRDCTVCSRYIGGVNYLKRRLKAYTHV